MQRFIFDNLQLDADDPRMRAALAEAYAAKHRPRCGCVEGGVPMYIAFAADKYLIKRMPETGCLHHPDCYSFEPPSELSGLGEVRGSAIKEDLESGLTTLRFDFSLSKGPGRAPPPPSSGDPADSVKSETSKLTMRGLLHYLWEEGGLTRSAPTNRRRSWQVVRSSLLEAAQSKLAKGHALETVVFVPEAFDLERKDEILGRRLRKLAGLSKVDRGTRPLMMAIVEVKDVQPSRYGQKIIAKHLPDMPLMMSDDLHRRLLKRFEVEIDLWGADTLSHLVAIASFGLDHAGNACIEEASLMLTSANWIPVEHRWDVQLIDSLTRADRRFTKAMRYNLPTTRPLASMVLSDTTPAAVGMFVVPADASPEYREALHRLVQDSQVPVWVWKAGETAMPPLPDLVDYVPMAIEDLADTEPFDDVDLDEA